MRIMHKKARDHHIQASCTRVTSCNSQGLERTATWPQLPMFLQRLSGRVLCMTVTVLKVCPVHLLYFDSYWLKNSSCKVICCCSKLSKASESQPILSSLEKINHNCKNFDSCILCLHLGVCCRWVLSRLVHLFL